MYVVYWDKVNINRYRIEVRETEYGDYCINPSECQWIVPGTVGVDD